MKRIAILLLMVALAGCAKFPSSGGPSSNTRVTFSMTVDGEINPNRIYIVAIRWSKQTPPHGSTGPIPVIAPPWGNGFVAGRANVFVQYDPLQGSAHPFVVYRFRDPVPDNSDPVSGQVYLSQWDRTDYPVSFVDVEPGTKTLRFTLDMSQIAENVGDIPLIQELQVNFLTMDRIPQGSDTGSKTYEGLGDTNLPSGINEWVTFPVTRDGTYNNSTGINAGLEPRGDVPEPDLDIVDWQIEVRRQ
jgi:hypothetical protein